MIGAVAVDAEVPTTTSGWRASSRRWSPVVSHTSTVVATVAPGAVATRPAVGSAWHAIAAITKAALKLFSASSILIGGDYVANRSGPQTRIAERAQLRQHTDVELRDGRCNTPTLKHALERAARQVHAKVIEQGKADPEAAGMATTLTLFIGVWPWAYLLQVGDSRYYQYRDGVLSQISHDQTMAQVLVDQGIMTRSLSEHSPLSNVLVSSIGGAQTAPVVTRMPNTWDNIHLLCTDGLTRHVSDEQIAERLGSMTSARQACEDLLQDALDAGGTDNITIIVGRAVPADN